MDILDLNDMDQITDSIWLGNLNSALNINKLKKEEIKKILTIIAYLMWKQKMKYEEAYNYVKDKRKRIGPNSGFKQQLKILEKLLIQNDYDINKIDFNNIEHCENSDYFESVK